MTTFIQVLAIFLLLITALPGTGLLFAFLKQWITNFKKATKGQLISSIDQLKQQDIKSAALS